MDYKDDHEPQSRRFTHIDEKGAAVMVDVTDKGETDRTATAECLIRMKPSTLSLLMKGEGPKGEVFSTSRIAAIMAAKSTPSLIPMCHPIRLTGIKVEFEVKEAEGEVAIRVEARTSDRTGVEMEAMCAASIGALTIYDMCKAVDKQMTIGPLMLLSKSGGKSGQFIRKAGEV